MKTIVPAGHFRGVLPVLLFGTIVLVYEPLASFPYVQDDWGILRTLTFTPIGRFIADACTPAGDLFYRPLPLIYFSLLYGLGGLCAPLFHSLSLLALAFASFLVVDVGNRLTGNTVAGWGAGFLFATAATVHLDTQMWLVGMYDIGAVLFALLSVSLLLRDRNTASAFSVAAALGCKEAAISLPLILVILWYAVVRAPGEGGTGKALWGRFRIHAAVFTLYAAARSGAPFIVTLPASHPYAHQLTFGNVLDNARLYAYRSIEALGPFKSADPAGHAMMTAGGLLIVGVTLGVLLAALRAATGGTRARRCCIIVALVSWAALVMVLPVLLGSMHNAYYLLSALPPLALAVTSAAQMLVSRLGTRTLFSAIIIALAAANAVDGSMFIRRKVGLGQDDGRHAQSWDGDNHLVRKAGVVRVVWKPLLAIAPGVPPHSVFLFPGIDTRTFQDGAGPQSWYRDSTLRVAALNPGYTVRDGRISLLFPPGDPANGSGKPMVEAVDMERILVFRLASDSLLQVPLGEFLRGENP